MKFVLKRDRLPVFHFAPLLGATFVARVAADWRETAADTMVVETRAGGLLTRSDAWVYILRRLGGFWKICAALLTAIPRPIRNVSYDLVARTRYRIFGQQGNACPLLPPHLADRFHP